jgi:hypothetical protein
MTLCIFVLGNGSVATQTRDCEPHVLGGAKGRWARLVDTPPAYNTAYQTLTRTVPANVPSGDVTVQYTVADRPLAAFKTERKALVKINCRTRILAVYADWKQMNMTARAIELLKLGQQGSPEGLALQASWDWVKAMRANSDTLEAGIDAATTAQAVAAAATDSGWPT